MPTLKIQFSHFAGGIGRYLGRIRGFQQRDKWGTAKLPRHGRRPAKPFDHYLDQRLFYDIAGWAGPDHAAEWGADWVRFGFEELAFSQLVFATDYPQAVRDAGEVAPMSRRCAALGANGRAIAGGANAEKLIPDLRRRLAARPRESEKRLTHERQVLLPKDTDFDPAANGWELKAHGFGELDRADLAREAAGGCALVLSSRRNISTAAAICMAAC